MNKHVILEIGTNSIKRLYAEYHDGTWQNLSDALYPARLGENLESTGVLNQIAMERNLNILVKALSPYKEQADCTIHIIATESLRKAHNADEFVDMVKLITGCGIEIISGENEAELSFLGATLHSAVNDETICVIDIGGGSTELTLAQGKNIKSKESMPIGAVKLTEICFHNDPVIIEELSIIRKLINRHVHRLEVNVTIDRIIGVGGIFTALAILKSREGSGDFKAIDNSVLSLADIQQMIDFFSGKTVSEIELIPNMPTGRADIILAGSIILECIMLRLALPEVYVCIRGVRHGYLYSRVKP